MGEKKPVDIKELKSKLRNYKKEDIIFTEHAEFQAFVREVDLDDVRESMVNPEKLVYLKEEKAKHPNEVKYCCYFAYSKHLYHKYVLTLNKKIIIVTIIKINRDWQKAVG